MLIGVDMVSGALFDGRTDRSRMRIVSVPDGEVMLPPTEDMIADRLGQWDGSNRQDMDLLGQACSMFLLAGEIDHTYLDRRIREETAGAVDVQALIRFVRG